METVSGQEERQKANGPRIQFHWSSAYGSYGTGSLDRDREEMQALVKYLKTTGGNYLLFLWAPAALSDMVQAYPQLLSWVTRQAPKTSCTISPLPSTTIRPTTSTEGSCKRPSLTEKSVPKINHTATISLWQKIWSKREKDMK